MPLCWHKPGVKKLKGKIKPTSEEKDWMDQVTTLDEKEWWRKGVKLYRRLLNSDPQNVRFKQRLGELLLELGRDKKMREFHYKEARNLFEEILSFYPDHLYAHYHLGVLDVNDCQWNDAITHLKIPVESIHFEEELRVKAICYLAVAYHHLDYTEDAEELLQKALSLNTELNNEAIEFAKYNLSLRPIETSKPYFIESSEWDRYLDPDEYDQYRRARPGTIILNLSLEKPEFIGQKKTVMLSRACAELLAYLMENHRVINAEEIKKNVYGEDKSQTIVKTNISRLRKQINPCFGEPATEIIKTYRGPAYKWNWSGDYRIIRRTV